MFGRAGVDVADVSLGFAQPFLEPGLKNCHVLTWPDEAILGDPQPEIIDAPLFRCGHRISD